MNFFFKILFFVLYPVIIYSQDSLGISNDTSSKPYFESVTLNGGILVGPYLYFERNYNQDIKWQMYQFPIRLQIEKRIDKNKLITIGLWRNAVDNSNNKWRAFPVPNFEFDISKKWSWRETEPPFSNWTIALDYQQMLIQRRFSLSYSIGYGLEYGSDWYLGISLHSGINVSYRIAPNLCITLGAGARSMYGGFFAQAESMTVLSYEKYGPYQPWQVSYAFMGIKWKFKEHQADTTEIKKYFKTLRPSKKLGFGFAYTMSGKDNTILHNKIADDPDNYDDLNISSDDYSFPYLQINSVAKKFRMHSLGFGFRKRYETTATLKSYRFFYQYDFPLLKSKKRISLLYSGLNLSSHIEESDFRGYRYFTPIPGGGYLVINQTITLTSRSNMVSLSLPLGYKKEISSSGVWIDLGLNLNIMAYGYGKYDHTYNAKGPLPSNTISRKGSMDEFIFYPSELKKLNIGERFISNIYFKIIFM